MPGLAQEHIYIPGLGTVVYIANFISVTRLQNVELLLPRDAMHPRY